MKHKILVVVLIVFALVGSYVSVRLWWWDQYDRDRFNCVDMSYCLAPFFHRMGFDTKIVYGSNTKTAHAWISINGLYFDAVSLSFSTEEKYPRITFVDSYPYGYTDELKKGRT